MNDLPSISLVTPCFNQVSLIDAALRSVLEQGYPDLEYVVIDGGSSDGSAEVIASHSDHLAYWVSEPDDGHYPALNKGFVRTSGEVMGYLNGDDTLLPGALFTVGSIFRDFPEIDWITGAHLAIDEEGRPVSVDLPAQWSRWHLLSDRTQRFIPQESTFWRRSLWERSGARLDDSYSLAADFELWARFSRSAKLYTVFAPLGCFRFVAGQRSVAQRDAYMDQVRQIRERERRLTPAGARATRVATAALAVTDQIGLRRLRRPVNRALGAPPELVFDQQAYSFGMTETSTRGAKSRALFERLARAGGDGPGR
ncbi:MAG TPA: glycosyltransferase family 2 protein [Actinomycetota bacterium]|nr:glycosyltransferase family 2 protein [Actinomycetota bacterium]